MSGFSRLGKRNRYYRVICGDFSFQKFTKFTKFTHFRVRVWCLFLKNKDTNKANLRTHLKFDYQQSEELGAMEIGSW